MLVTLLAPLLSRPRPSALLYDAKIRGMDLRKKISEEYVCLSRECACSISGGGERCLLELFHVGVSLIDVQYSTSTVQYTPYPSSPKCKSPTFFLSTCKHPPSSLPKVLHVLNPPRNPRQIFKNQKHLKLRHLSLSNTTPTPSPTTPKERETQNIVSSVQFLLYHVYITLLIRPHL